MKRTMPVSYTHLAAVCLMYKERVQHSEETPLKVYYTDRQGVPVAIELSVSLFFPSFPAVSYTHLDVYKRQAYDPRPYQVPVAHPSVRR